MSIDRTDPPEPKEPTESPEPPEDDGGDGDHEPRPTRPTPTAARPRLDDRQTLDRRTIDDSFARKRRELGFPAAPDPEPVPRSPDVPDEPDEPDAPDDPRRRVVFAVALVVGVSLTLGLVAGTCFGGSPEPPLEALGLGRAETKPEDTEPEDTQPEDTQPEDTAPVGSKPGDAVDDDSAGEEELDPEQQAFAERRERELTARQSEAEPGNAVPDFTDHALVQELAGSWRLDLGRGRRGYRVRFGSDSVRTVHRQRFDVTLFDVVGRGAAGRGLPPYYTVLDLPDGKLLAFLDASGTFRLVLEDVRRESDGRLSWRGPLRERRYGERLDGESAWRFDHRREEPPPMEIQSETPPETQPEPPPETPSVDVRPRPGAVSEATRSRFYDTLEHHLDELAFGLMERDADRVYTLWGGRPDDITRAAVEGLLERYSSLRVWTRLLTVDVESTPDGPQARFEVVVTIQGAPKGARNRRDVDLRDVRWRGRLGAPEPAAGRGDPRQLDPFPG